MPFCGIRFRLSYVIRHQPVGQFEVLFGDSLKSLSLGQRDKSLLSDIGVSALYLTEL